VTSPAAPAWARRTLCLLVVFFAAKLTLIAMRAAAGLGAPLVSAWTLPAFVYQDLWVTALWAALDLGLSRLRAPSAIGWTLYALVVVYVAFNVPAAALFSTPLTWPIVAAAGAALSDSIAVYLNARNLVPLAVVLAVGAIAPFVIKRPGRRVAIAAAGASLLLGALGPFAVSRVESLGLHRNALFTLVSTALRHNARAGHAPSPAPLTAEGDARDLSSLRGVAKNRPVVWVILESTAARYLKPYGAPSDPMPRLSELAARGLVFDAMYAVYPESIKGLFSGLCSHAPAAHTSPDRYTEKTLPCPSLPSRFAAAGYRTALFHSGRFVYLGMRGIVESRFQHLADAGDVGGKFASSFGVDEASTVRTMLAWIDALPRSTPFFLIYTPITGHHPYHSPGEGPRPFGDSREADAYLSDLYRGDLALGQFIDGVRARDPLIVVSGDHGEAFEQHPGNFAHTLFLYEENVHIPFIVSGVPLSGRVPQVGSLLDAAPTLLELAGLPVPSEYEGRSLLAATPGIARFYTDQSLWQVGLRMGPWKFIHEIESGRSRLFDLTQDPDEKNDLSSQHAERAARFSAHLRGWAALQRAKVLK
jgi:hypothetical protein